MYLLSAQDLEREVFFYLGLHFMWLDDYDKAFKWLEFGANLDSTFSQLQLGIMYLYGKRVEKNVNLGYNYLFQSFLNGNNRACEYLWRYYEQVGAMDKASYWKQMDGSTVDLADEGS